MLTTRPAVTTIPAGRGAALKRTAYSLLKYAGAISVARRWSAGTLAILMYHGVWPDRLAGASWMPPHFVTESQFRSQMRFVRERMHPVGLIAGLDGLRQRARPRHPVAITFDDGYWNNVALAAPILAGRGIPATVFLSTGHVASGRFFNHDRLRLIRHWQREDGAVPLALDLKTLSVEEADRQLDPLWDRLSARLTRDQVESFRPMSWDELRTGPSVLEWGAHTVSHAILSRETDDAARREIADSVQAIRARLGVRRLAFAYPNGTSADFAEPHVRALRELDVACAVTTSPGANTGATDPFRLLRYPITLGHEPAVFEAEVAGLRSRMAGGAY